MAMGATKAQRGRGAPRHALLDNGVAALVFGAVCLVLPLFLDLSPALRSIGQMLRIPAAVGLVLGAVLLVLHASARRHPRAGGSRQPSPGASAERLATAPDGWSLELFEAMGSHAFEAVCEALFAQGGFTTRTLPDVVGGTDICLYSKHARGPAAIVHCTHERGATVGVDEVCAFYGVMVARQIKRGTYVTNARFTADAKQFGKANAINLLDGERLLAVIATRTPEQRSELLAAASERV